MKKITVLVFVFFALSVTAQDKLQKIVLSQDKMKEDFRFYRDILENTHPGLYRYNSKPEMTAILDSIENLLNRDMKYYEFYKILAGLNSSIRCAHSFIIPEKDFRSFMMYKTKSIPFYLFQIEDQMIVLFNGSNNQDIKPGFELIEINGKPIKDVVDQMTSMYWADGYNLSGKRQVLEGPVFAIFYYLFIDHSESYEMIFKNEFGEEKSFRLSAQAFSEAQKGFRKNPVNKEVLKKFKKSANKYWDLKFLKEVESTAYIRMNGFSDKKVNSNETAASIMREFMEKSLAKMEKNRTKNLILDLRDNKGGWDAMGIELYKYLSISEESFKFYRESIVVTNDTSYLKYSDLSAVDIATLDQELIPQGDGTFLLDSEFNETGQINLPASNRFKGKLYILISKNTGSAAAEFAAIAKSNQIGTIVGEESGGAYEGGNGGSFLNFELPNSKMYVRTPLVKVELEVIELPVKGYGVMPDIEVRFKQEDLLIRNDRQLKYVINLIKGDK